MANRYEGMKCVVHRDSNFSKTVKKFQDKRVSVLMNRMSDCEWYQLKIIKQTPEFRAR